MASSVRKLQITGRGSYILTLPKEWIEKNKLTKGSEVLIIYEPDGSLRILPTRDASSRDRGYIAKIEFKGENIDSLLRLIISYYVAGADIIEITVREMKREDIKKLLGMVEHRTMGLEVVEESSEKIVLQVIIDPSSMPINESFSKLARTVEHMLEDLESGIRGKEPHLLLEVASRDDVADKLFLHIWRQVMLALSNRYLASELGVKNYALMGLLMVAAKNIERIGDHVARIAEIVSEALEVDGDIQRLADLINPIRLLFSETVKVFKKPSEDNVEALIEKALLIKQSAIGEFKEKTREIKHAKILGRLWLVTESLSRIVDYCVDILELSLNELSILTLTMK